LLFFEAMSSRPRKRPRHLRRGVTIFEAAALLAGAAVLAGGAWFVSSETDQHERVGSAYRNANVIYTAAERWSRDNAAGCPTISELVEEQYLAREAPADDAWGQRFRILCDNGTLSVVSPGPDGKLKSADDVRAPD
jgi:hypothetical protein